MLVGDAMLLLPQMADIIANHDDSLAPLVSITRQELCFFQRHVNGIREAALRICRLRPT
jgi:hypothetical protein